MFTSAYYPRIYFGLANVLQWRTGYSVRFQHSARQDDDIHCPVTVFIPNELLENFRANPRFWQLSRRLAKKTGNVLSVMSLAVSRDLSITTNI